MNLVITSVFDGVMEEFFLFDSHLSSSLPRSLMLISEQMEHAMDHQEDDHFHTVQPESIRLALGCLHRDDQIPQKLRV